MTRSWGEGEGEWETREGLTLGARVRESGVSGGTLRDLALGAGAREWELQTCSWGEGEHLKIKAVQTRSMAVTAVLWTVLDGVVCPVHCPSRWLRLRSNGYGYGNRMTYPLRP